ncbi:putative nuclease HARBI1 [Chionoecetes opilio]|uniref:Putative nuclease HARBI1 n=1 Tax=Chionoecetes opilio TaxID=41210 RepID=A0A8J5D1K4_CHIOP|nr:putative nuclease HARBI1 [Chionoecetes opilio]
MDAEREIPGDNQPEDVLGYDDLVLIERYGLDGAGLAEVTGLVRDKITPASHRRNSRTAKTKLTKVAITLRYLVTGNFDLVADIDPGATSHQTISKVITETLEALVTPEFITRYIKFLTHPGAFHLKVHEFMMLSGFPDAVGVIDCTHVKISRPKQPDDIHYLNPQGFYSINTQLVFDASCRILNVAADWPGSMEDVTVLSKSGLQQLFEKETKSGSCHLVGDSDYETLVWLMTPVFEPPRKRKEKKYNRRCRKEQAHATVECGTESCKQCELDGDVDEELEKNLHSWTQLDVQDNVPLSPDMFPMEHRQIWVDLFIRYNTPVPSSAAVERLFSMGSDVMRPKRSSLTAKNFEKLVFLKGNMNLLKASGTVSASFCPSLNAEGPLEESQSQSQASAALDSLEVARRAAVLRSASRLVQTSSFPR